MRNPRVPKLVAGLLVFSLVALLPSCGPMSRNPLGSAEKSKPDEHLYGVWRGADKGGAAYLFIGAVPHGPEGPPGLMSAFFVTYKGENHELGAFGPLVFFPTTIGGARFANVYYPSDPEGPAPAKGQLDLKGPFLLAKYALDKDTLTVCFMENDAAERAVKDGRIKGVTESQGFGRRTLLTDGSEQLAKFLQGGGDKELFPESKKATFSRLR